MEVERELVLRAVGLRERGWSYRRIAQVLDVSLGTAFNYVWRHFAELEAMATEKLEHVRTMELARMDRILRRLDKALMSPDDDVAVKAGAAMTKVSESRRKLMGADAPAKVDHSHTNIDPGEEASSVRAKLVAALEDVDRQIAATEPKEVH